MCVCVCVHLKGLYKGPQQDPDGVALPQQLDETSRPEQPEEAQVDQLVLWDTHTHPVHTHTVQTHTQYTHTHS